MRSLSFHWFLFLALTPLIGALPASSATRIWRGTSNTNWADAKNWSNNVAPRLGDTLLFPYDASRRTNWNSLTQSFSSIRINGYYSVSGSPISTTELIFGPDDNFSGFVTLRNQINLLANGTLSLGVSHIHGPIALAGGKVTLAGGEVALYGPIRGTAAITVRGGVSFYSTNEFSGTLTIATNASLGVFSPANLGPSNVPVTVAPGGRLFLSGCSLDNPVEIGGSGYRGLGALAGSGARLGSPLRVTSPTVVQLLGGLRLAGAQPAQGASDPRLTFIGGGGLMAINPTNTFALPVELKEGSFFLSENPDSFRQFSEVPFTNFYAGLKVGVTNSRAAPVRCDLYLPKFLGQDRLGYTYAFAEGKPVTVYSGATLSVGPRQIGLGWPLNLFGGVLELRRNALYRDVPWSAQAVGDIRVEGPNESKVIGGLLVGDPVTIRSQTRAKLRFSDFASPGEFGGIHGGTLVIDGPLITMAGARANTLTNLLIQHGEVTLSATAASGARNIVVGLENPAEARAWLRAVGNQFLPGAKVVLKASGQFFASGANSLDSLDFEGGEAEVSSLTVTNFTAASGGKLRLWIGQPASGPLRITGRIAGNSFPKVELRSQTAVATNQPLVLVRNDTPAPIPGVFEDLPPGGVITFQAATYRVNYAGGDGNDLALEPFTSQEPAKLVLTLSPNGPASVSWPETSGCQLEFQPVYNPSGVWTPVTVGAAVDGTFTFTLNPTEAQPSGFYRLNCP